MDGGAAPDHGDEDSLITETTATTTKTMES
jgi:hypothetical protein